MKNQLSFALVAWACLISGTARNVLAIDVTGTWKSDFDSPIGHQNYTFTFKQDGTKLTGKAKSEAGDRKREAELKEGKVDGDAISFFETLTIQENDVRIVYTGKISADGNEIKFTREVGNFGKSDIVARREQNGSPATPHAVKTIRIKAGKSEPVKDTEGNVWLADQGFEGGQTIERPNIQIANTKSPDLYRAERYSMDSFSWPVPNGKYVVKLHFAETFDGITGPGQRVFSFKVQGHEFKDFDVWAKAGGPLRAYVETVNAEVTDGKIKITFTPKVENPQINAIEIIPQGAAETSESATAPAQPAAPASLEVVTPAEPSQLPIAKGPFAGTMASLTDYSYPEWFRDAKFGIWAHWGPQAVPMEGDWYARKMYQQGSPDYQDHLKRWGHPSTNGWKDIIPLWKAEHWDPEKLIELYKKAGARYFVSMGSHHDNFFLWNSRLHRWNSVEMGPHRDVVGEWQKAAKKNGLHFGVSEHLGASFTWFQDAHKSDKTGPLAGIPYDGSNSNYWDLYHFPADPTDRGWYSKNPKWQQQWFNEIEELVDSYKPDLLYTDGGVAFGNEVGLSQIANFYNVNAATHHGKCEAVYTCKQPSNGRWVQDYERGVNAGISPYPWQTDTSIGDWFYNRHWKYQPVSWTVHMLVDIVSKNGNLLLNVVMRPDGALDPEVETMLHQLADWTAINGEAIYGTRPWLVYGEGAVQAKGGAFRENMAYSAKDIRFTTKGKTLYAVALGWPEDGKLVIKSLAKTTDPTQNRIKKIELLGQSGKLKFGQTADGLVVELPVQRLSDLTCSLRISGSNFQPASSPSAPASTRLGQ